MIETDIFLNECKRRNITLFTGTPCSYLKPFINRVIDDSELDFVSVTNEGDAVALAAGAWLGDRKSIVMFQNSGLGNAVNPLVSLSHTMNIPFIGIVTLRGEPGGVPDEPQHSLMGEITTQMLDLMQISWSYFPTKEEKVANSLYMAEQIIEETKQPFFFVMKKDSVIKYDLKSVLEERKSIIHSPELYRNLSRTISSTRTQALEKIKQTLGPKAIYVATTGMTGRELYTIEDSANQLYMVGSMGCALPIGLGLCQTSIKQKVCVIDGDGALLMRLGNMALAGQLNPNNLIHILLDNGTHDSTGGQRTFSEVVDFCDIAKASGYQHIYEVDSLPEFEKALNHLNQVHYGLSFIRFTILPGSPKEIGRPKVTPAEVALRLKNHLKETNESNH